MHIAYPRLASKLPLLEIAELPTPLRRVSDPQGDVLIKHDGRAHHLYGGNKVRKLEYLLGQARSHGCTRVATFGAAGSNHATATAVHAQGAGLGCMNFLSRQRNTPWVAKNLKIQLQSNAQIVYVKGHLDRCKQQAAQHLADLKGRSWLIPMGGSSIAGSIGYVNAAMEFAQQLIDQALTPPDRIYVPLGTMGTAVGLAIGLQVAGLTMPVIAVRVVDDSVGSAPLARQLFNNTVRALRFLDREFPALKFDPNLLQIRHEQLGPGYAAATAAGQSAVQHASEFWQLNTETTYTGKTIAAVLQDRQAGHTTRPLYWATYTEPHPPLDEHDRVDLLPLPLRQYWSIDAGNSLSNNN